MSDKSELSTSPLTYHAGRAVFDISELRQRILGLLPKPALAKCMRIGGDYIKDVARDLYRVMGFDMVYHHMFCDSPRAKLYCDSIIDIDAQQITFTDSDLTHLAGRMKMVNRYIRHKTPEAQLENYQRGYRPEVIELLIPRLLAKCPQLLRVHFGPAESGRTIETIKPSWIVHLASASDHCTAAGTEDVDIEETIEGGHIAYHACYAMEIDNGPPPINGPSTFDPDKLPPHALPGQWTIRETFDLDLFNSKQIIDPQQVERWIEAFKGGRCLGYLNSIILFGNLPISLDTIISIYERQIASGYPERLKSISALHIDPYDINEFISFAHVAGKSLVFLDLHNYWRIRYRDDRTLLSFDDLPILIHTVRTALPNLKKLWVWMKGIEGAEELCRDILTSVEQMVGVESSNTKADEYCRGLLKMPVGDLGGTVYDLRITTAVHEGEVKTVIRFLGLLCTSSTKVVVSESRSGFMSQ